MSLRLAALAVGLAVMVYGGGAGAEGSIYRCAGATGVPLYTDVPCKGGTILDIRPGDPDPAAIERLARLRAQFDARAAAEAARSYEDERAYAPGSRGGFGSYDDQAGAMAGDDVAYSPIYVSYRPFFRPGNGHRRRRERVEPRRFTSSHRFTSPSAMTGSFRSHFAGEARGRMPQGR